MTNEKWNGRGSPDTRVGSSYDNPKPVEETGPQSISDVIKDRRAIRQASNMQRAKRGDRRV